MQRRRPQSLVALEGRQILDNTLPRVRNMAAAGDGDLGELFGDGRGER
jgi:hypothetical protein